MLTRTFGVLVCTLALGCGGSQKSAGGGANPCGANPCGDMGNPCGDVANPCGNPCGGMGNPCGAAASDAAPDVSGYAGWTKLNKNRFFSKSHNKSYVDVYVQPEHAESYRAGQGVEGMVVAKVQYAGESGGSPMAITVMKKMAAGYDPDNSDWWYGVYNPDGKTTKMAGKIDGCINCHTGADGDYLFSDEVVGK